MPVIVGTSDPETLDGTSGDDSIFGLGGNDVLNGLDGNDYLEGGADNDVMNGGGGDDVYAVDSGDLVNEADGEGFDIIYATASFVLTGTSRVERLSAINHLDTFALNLSGNDNAMEILGNNGANVLSGGAAADVLLGFDGDDTLNGGGGNDALFGMGGTDTLNGGAGNDYLDGGAGNDSLAGGANDDVYLVDSGDTVSEAAGEGFDTIYAATSYALAGAASVERLSAIDHAATTAINLTAGSAGAQLLGNAGVNVLTGGIGNDTLLGFGGNDTQNGGDGDDALFGMDGRDTLNGNAGIDFLDGGAGNDRLAGGAGNDTYIVDDSSDLTVESSGQGQDIVYASVDYRAGADIEILFAVDSAATNAMRLFGSLQTIAIAGNSGANLLEGGGAAATLYGLGGADIFNFRNGLGGIDQSDSSAFGAPPVVVTIVDFEPGADKIRLDTTKFSGVLGTGTAFFESGATATAPGTRLLYNPANGILYQDPDGSGAFSAQAFAQLTPGLALTAADFIIEANQTPVANSDNYELSFTSSNVVISTPMRVNDFDVDGYTLWVTRMGAQGQPLIDVGRGLSATTATGVYGRLTGGGKSGTFDYTLDASDPDTAALTAGQTVTETFVYEISDGIRQPVLQDPPTAWALTAQSTITITITRTASGALESSAAAAPPADAAAPASDPVPASAFTDGYPSEAIWQVRSGDALAGMVQDLWVG